MVGGVVVGAGAVLLKQMGDGKKGASDVTKERGLAMTEVDRRDFLRGAGLATAAVAVPAEAAAIARAAKGDAGRSRRHAVRFDSLHRLQGLRGRLQGGQQHAC